MKVLIILILNIFPYIYCNDVCDGCPIFLEDKVLRKFRPIIESYMNYISNFDNRIYIDKFDGGSVIADSGYVYTIEFSSIKTDCPKQKILKRRCNIIDQQDDCEVKLWEKEWHGNPEVKSIDCLEL